MAKNDTNHTRSYTRTVVSLFSGAGFGDMGFESQGFQHLLFCEIDQKRSEFTAVNFPDAKILSLDIAKNVEKISHQIQTSLLSIKQKQPFLLYATPPCQGMSKNGIGTILKAITDKKRPKFDQRNRLYLPVIELVKKTLPKWIFFEKENLTISTRHSFLPDKIITDRKN